MLEDETIHVHLDWTHYPHDPSNTPSALTFTSTSVAEVYWRIVVAIRDADAAGPPRPRALQKIGMPFQHVRRLNKSRVTDKPVFVDVADGVEYEVTADRKRKLVDVPTALSQLGLCARLVHVHEGNGAPVVDGRSVPCSCRARHAAPAGGGGGAGAAGAAASAAAGGGAGAAASAASAGAAAGAGAPTCGGAGGGGTASGGGGSGGGGAGGGGGGGCGGGRAGRGGSASSSAAADARARARKTGVAGGAQPPAAPSCGGPGQAGAGGVLAANGGCGGCGGCATAAAAGGGAAGGGAAAAGGASTGTQPLSKRARAAAAAAAAAAAVAASAPAHPSLQLPTLPKRLFALWDLLTASKAAALADSALSEFSAAASERAAGAGGALAPPLSSGVPPVVGLGAEDVAHCAEVAKLFVANPISGAEGALLPCLVRTAFEANAGYALAGGTHVPYAESMLERLDGGLNALVVALTLLSAQIGRAVQRHASPPGLDPLAVVPTPTPTHTPHLGCAPALGAGAGGAAGGGGGGAAAAASAVAASAARRASAARGAPPGVAGAGAAPKGGGGLAGGGADGGGALCSAAAAAAAAAAPAASRVAAETMGAAEKAVSGALQALVVLLSGLRAVQRLPLSPLVALCRQAAPTAQVPELPSGAALAGAEVLDACRQIATHAHALTRLSDMMGKVGTSCANAHRQWHGLREAMRAIRDLPTATAIRAVDAPPSMARTMALPLPPPLPPPIPHTAELGVPAPASAGGADGSAAAASDTWASAQVAIVALHSAAMAVCTAVGAHVRDVQRSCRLDASHCIRAFMASFQHRQSELVQEINRLSSALCQQREKRQLYEKIAASAGTTSAVPPTPTLADDAQCVAKMAECASAAGALRMDALRLAMLEVHIAYGTLPSAKREPAPDANLPRESTLFDLNPHMSQLLRLQQAASGAQRMHRADMAAHEALMAQAAAAAAKPEAVAATAPVSEAAPRAAEAGPAARAPAAVQHAPAAESGAPADGEAGEAAATVATEGAPSPTENERMEVDDEFNSPASPTAHAPASIGAADASAEAPMAPASDDEAVVAPLASAADDAVERAPSSAAPEGVLAPQPEPTAQPSSTVMREVPATATAAAPEADDGGEPVAAYSPEGRDAPASSARADDDDASLGEDKAPLDGLDGDVHMGEPGDRPGREGGQGDAA